MHKKKNKQHLLVLLYNKHNQGQNQWLKQLDLLNQQLNLLRMVHLLLVLEMESATLAYFATGGGTYTSYDAFATSASGSYYLTGYLATFAKGTTATGTCSGSGSRS